MNKIFKSKKITNDKTIGIYTTVVGLVACAIILRLWSIQILKQDYYSQKSKSNHVSRMEIPAPRGLFFDRHNKLLLGNKNVYTLVYIAQESIKLSAALTRVSDLTKVPLATIQSRIKWGRNQKKYIPIPIMRGLSSDQVSRFKSQEHLLSGFRVMSEPGRRYQEYLPVHMLGYLSEINQHDLQKKSVSSNKYAVGDLIGKQGLEKKYEAHLRGTKGFEHIVVDAKGKKIKISDPMFSSKPKPGLDIHLTIDKKLQEKVHEVFKSKNGAVVALDPNNGAILAIKSMPEFNPKIFQSRISHKAWQKLNLNPFAPLLDKTVSAEFPPGSLYKIVVALAGLEQAMTNTRRKILCKGSFQIANETFHCHHRGGHGKVNLAQALMHSCDVYFYQLGIELGVNQIARYAKDLGLGSQYGVNFGHEKSGLIPTRLWKRLTYNRSWKRGETPPVSIGQGYNLLTPLQMANLFATVANEGTIWKPFVVSKITDNFGRQVESYQPRIIKKSQLIRPSYFRLVKNMLESVVNHPKGTGKYAKLSDIRVAGKTGTVQVVNLKKYKGFKEVSMLWNEHAIFAAYAPAKKPRIALVVFSEHDRDGGGGSKSAAPLAREIIAEYLNPSNLAKSKETHDYENL